VLYTLSGQRTKLDTVVEEQFGKLYRLVEINQLQHAYTHPKLSDGFGPAEPVYIDGQCQTGRALVLVIITEQGTVSSPYVAEATSPGLNEAAINRMNKKRYHPAELDGKAVSVVIGVLVAFTCPSGSK
jgi:hypothetical protein